MVTISHEANLMDCESTQGDYWIAEQNWAPAENRFVLRGLVPSFENRLVMIAILAAAILAVAILAAEPFALSAVAPAVNS